MKVSDLERARDPGAPTGAAADSPAHRAASSGVLNQLHKTKMCAFYRRGACRHGSECSWAHSEGELKILPDLRRTRLCAAFQERGCCDDPQCAFAHGEEDLRATAVFYRKKLCVWNAKGRCRNGDQCRFAHGHRQLAQERQRGHAVGAEAQRPPGAGGPPAAPRSASGAGAARRAPAAPAPRGGLPCAAQAGVASATALPGGQGEPMKVYPAGPAHGDEHPAFLTAPGAVAKGQTESLALRLESLCHQLSVLAQQCGQVPHQGFSPACAGPDVGPGSAVFSTISVPRSGFGVPGCAGLGPLVPSSTPWAA